MRSTSLTVVPCDLQESEADESQVLPGLVRAIIRAAEGSLTPIEFAERALAQLQVAIRFEAGLVDLHPHVTTSNGPICIGMLQSELSRDPLERRKYMLELERACAIAPAGIVAAHEGLLHSSRMAGCQYFREIVAATGGTHYLWGLSHMRGTVAGALTLIRHGRPFSAHEQAHVSLMLPLLAICSSSLQSSPAVGSDRRFGAAVREVRLSEREREILGYLQMGYTNMEIALACGSAPNTVRNQLARIFRKIGATTRAEAVGLSLRK